MSSRPTGMTGNEITQTFIILRANPDLRIDLKSFLQFSIVINIRQAEYNAMSENFTKIWIKFFLSSNQTFLIINISFLTFSPELDDEGQARLETSCHHLADELDREHSPVSSSPPVLEMTPELEKCRLCYFR